MFEDVESEHATAVDEDEDEAQVFALDKETIRCLREQRSPVDCVQFGVGVLADSIHLRRMPAERRKQINLIGVLVFEDVRDT